MEPGDLRKLREYRDGLTSEIQAHETAKVGYLADKSRPGENYLNSVVEGFSARILDEQKTKLEELFPELKQ